MFPAQIEESLVASDPEAATFRYVPKRLFVPATRSTTVRRSLEQRRYIGSARRKEPFKGPCAVCLSVLLAETRSLQLKTLCRVFAVEQPPSYASEHRTPPCHFLQRYATLCIRL
jgi:hypothetical protein